MLVTSSSNSKSPIGRYEIICIRDVEDNDLPMGKVSSISQFDGVVYYKYNEISTVQFKLYRMLDPTTGNSLAPDAKCDT